MAHTFQNLSFELEDAIPGSAYAWDQTVLATLAEHANFGYTSASPFETWDEGWGTAGFLVELDPLAIVNGLFPSGQLDPYNAENFEWGWLDHSFWIGELSIQADGGFTPISGPDLVADGYEEGWNNNTWSGTLVSMADGLFDAGANAEESFDFEYPQNAFGYWNGLSEVQGDFVDGM